MTGHKRTGGWAGWCLWAALVCSLAAWPCLSAPTSPGAKRQVIVGGDHNYPPFEWLDEKGQPTGFNTDLMRAIGEVMGFEITFRLEPWDHSRKALEEGRIDVLPMFYSPERDRIFDFSQPYSILYHKIFVRADGPRIASLEDLAGREVIVQTGAFMHDYLRAHDFGARLVLVETEPDAMRLLASGKHDCAVVTRLSGRQMIRRHDLSNLVPSGPPLLPCEYCLAVADGNTELVADLNEGLAILRETGRYDELYDKWFSGLLGRGVEVGVVARYAAWVLGPVLAIAVAALAWSWSLRKQVAQRTHHLEVELAERKRAENALRESERTLQTLLANLPGAAYRYTNATDWTMEFISAGIRNLTGYTPADFLASDRISFNKITHPDDQQRVCDGVQAALAKRKPYRLVYRIRTAGGTEKWIWEQGRGVFSPKGDLLCLEGFITDITDRVQAEHALHDSERKYRDLFEDSRDTIYRTSRDGRFLDINPAGLELFGDAREEMVGMPVERIYADPADRAAFLLAIENTNAVRNYELRFRHKDGTALDCLVTATVWRSPDGRVGGYHGIIRDVTERKRAEARLQAYHRQLRVLASELALAEERERRRMAEGLHDHVAQGLTVAKMRLDALRESAPDGDLADRLDDARRQVEETIRQTRNLIFDFSPPVLHELGFEAALEWLVEEFQARNRLPTSFEDDGRPKPLQEPVRLTLFRASRELLANVVKHARAGHVAVRVRRDGDEICVEVEDDGVGFDPAILNNHRNDDMAFGLFSIRERLDYYGGRLDIASAPGKGTRVTLAAPVARESHEGGSP